MTQPKTTRLTTLTTADITVLAVIFFGQPLLGAVLAWGQLQQAGQAAQTVYSGLEFGDFENWANLALQACLLALACAYLRLRRFDWRQLNFRLGRSTLPLAALLVLCAGGAASLFDWLVYGFGDAADALPLPEALTAEELLPSSSITLSLVLYSLFNGFYEELFFMGLVYAVPARTLRWVLPLSIALRWAFHIYQGLAAATTIALMGVVFAVFRHRQLQPQLQPQSQPQLWPFMLAHAFFDVFGLGLPGLGG